MAASAVARPAVYTRQRRGIRERLSSLAVPSIPLPVVIVVVLAISVATVFGPACTYYAAWREAGVLQAEYDALAAQNRELTHELERLQTIEGIEDEARSRGYVYPDEEALVVKGLEEEEADDLQLMEEAAREHEANQPWYISVLDRLFGYQHE